MKNIVFTLSALAVIVGCGNTTPSGTYSGNGGSWSTENTNASSSEKSEQLSQISSLSSQSRERALELQRVIERNIGGGSDLDRMIGNMGEINRLAADSSQDLSERMTRIASLASSCERDAEEIKGIINRYIGGGSDFDPIISNMRSIQSLAK